MKIEHNVDERDSVSPQDLAISSVKWPDGKVGELAITYTVIGEVTDSACLEYKDMKITMAEALETWKAPLEKVFKTRSGSETDDATKSMDKGLYDTKDVHICSHKIAQPTVFIPVFPGTNCEYDSTKHLKERERRLLPRYSRIWMRSTSVIPWKSLKKPLTRRR